jgi:hypothetical protein
MAIKQRTITPEYIGLPEFDVANVTIDNARVDKFEIVFPNHQIEYRNIDKFREYLQSMVLPSGLFSLYNPKPNAARAVRSEGLQFRAGRVFTGKRIYFKLTSAANRRRFAIKLQLNLSRFAANNDLETLTHLPAVDWDEYDEQGYPRLNLANIPFTGHRILEKNETRLNSHIEQALDRNDNWMRGAIWQATHNAEQYAESYIAACLDYIEDQFFFPLNSLDIPVRVANDGLPRIWDANPALLETEAGVMPIFNWSGFIINRAEVYHEFRHENAIDFMRYIAPRIREIAPIINEATHPHVKEGRTYDAPSVTVQLARGIYLCVYAKTMHRTRWEIRFKNSIRDTLNDITTTETSYSHGLIPIEGIGNQENHIRDLMRVAIRYATEALQRFMGQLRLDIPSTTSTAVMAAFIHEMARACDNNPTTINLVLSPLLRDGHITESELNRAAIGELCTRDVLHHAAVNKRNDANKRGYRITERYAEVLAALRQTL